MLSCAFPPGAPDLGTVAPAVDAARPLVVDDPVPTARFPGVCAGFDAGTGAGVEAGSGDDGCVADVLTPGSKSAGGGATLDLAGATGLPWPAL